MLSTYPLHSIRMRYRALKPLEIPETAVYILRIRAQHHMLPSKSLHSVIRQVGITHAEKNYCMRTEKKKKPLETEK